MDMSLSLSPVGKRRGGIPGKENLASLIKIVEGVPTDIIGLSVSDYLLVDATVRDIFFIDESTLRDAADIYALALASTLLNGSTMVGTAGKGIALYTTGTDQTILDRAMTYFLSIGAGECYTHYTDSKNYTNLENYA